MNTRPFFNKNILELESLFNERNDEPDFIDALHHELQFRNAPRAKELKKKVAQFLESIKLESTQVKASKPIPHSVISLDKLSNAEDAQDEVSLDGANSLLNLEENKPLSILSESHKLRPQLPITNNPDNILSAWTAIEVLSPQSFLKAEELANGDKYRVSRFVDEQWKWEAGGDKGKKDYRLYYQVVLGSVDMKAGMDALLNVYTDTRAERPRVKGEAVLATVMVDKDGRPADEGAIGISSFAWGLPVALQGNLKELARWPEIEQYLIKGMAKTLGIHTSDQQAQPILTGKIIQKAYDWLVNQLGLDSSMLKQPDFAIKTYQYFKDKNPPESLLLNSFFLNDLSRARDLIKTGNVSENLQRYLGMVRPAKRYDLMTNNSALAKAMQPKQFPLASWPANGRHPLVMLQQCAVNLALTDLKKDGILAVNGPPGTGKTTLLRDVVAAVVTERAEVMALYDDPETAFMHAEKVAKNGGFLHLYKIDEKLRGYEMVVASSNNKAVENVSAELPGIAAIADDAPGLRYFKSVSDRLLDRDTWGLIAAVLGNSTNRYAFTSEFWWNKDYGLQKYLLQASGTPVLIPDSSDENESLLRPPHILALENAPVDHADALRRWTLARKNFKQAKIAVERSLSDLQKVYDLQLELIEYKKEVLNLMVEIENLNNILKQLKMSAEALIVEIKQYKNVVDAAQNAFDDSRSIRPGFFSRLFSTSRYKSWKVSHDEKLEILTTTNKLYEKAVLQYKRIEKDVLGYNSKLDHFQLNKRKIETEIEHHLTLIADIKVRYPGTHIDEEFFDKSHRDKHLTAPWLGEAIALQRHRLFETAIALQKAFVDAAAKPIRHNMNMLVDNFCMESLGNAKKDELIPHIWSTLFFLVPVVSTTFASVGRMLVNLKSEDLGWLLIDEAGQALPQAAIGAIMRTKRAVVVGDPLQIPPVVPLSNLLTKAICAQFAIDPVVYNAPEASVQTLADNATSYFASFETGPGSRTVGVPLLVHRRCADPMFTISNAIAYENLMVHAKAKGNSPIRTVLGDSRWVHVAGHSEEKWCKQEGEVVLDILQRIRMANCSPDIYIVTPFVVVQDNMRKLIRDSGILEGWVDDAEAWPRSRIGTVHTVQGREAEAVIFILGASNSEQQGARIWAGGTPNLPNVAITRAKEVLYVVGNKDLWKSAGHFQMLATMLP